MHISHRQYKSTTLIITGWYPLDMLTVYYTSHAYKDNGTDLVHAPTRQKYFDQYHYSRSILRGYSAFSSQHVLTESGGDSLWSLPVISCVVVRRLAMRSPVILHTHKLA